MKRIIYTLSIAFLGFSASAQMVSNAQIYVSEGAVLSVGHDFENKGELINKGEIRLRQDLKNEGKLASDGSMIFDGSSKQKISGSQEVILSNATIENDVDLNTQLTIENQLNYDRGVLSSSNESPLVFAKKAEHFGASDYSHSKGTVIKLESDKFEFPVGNGSTYRGFEATSKNNSTLTAEYKNSNPAEISNELSVGVDNINNSEYWLLKSDDASEIATVKLSGTFEKEVAYLNKGSWSIAENATLDKKANISKGVAFTSGNGKVIKKDIGVWPNPTQGEFNLKLTGMNNNDQITVDLTNQDGRKIFTTQGKVSDLRKVYTLPQGLVTTELTLRVINGDEVMTEKLILHR